MQLGSHRGAYQRYGSTKEAAGLEGPWPGSWLEVEELPDYLAMPDKESKLRGDDVRVSADGT